MTLRTFVVFFWACLIGTAAVAGDQHRTEIKIAVDGEGTEHRMFHFDSQDSDVDLHALAVGESEVITDSDGNEVTVTRTDDGFAFDVGGEIIDIASMHGTHATEHIEIEKHHKVRMIKTDDSHGVTIISSEEINDETRTALEKVLKEAGKDGEILFIDGSELSGDELAHGTHEVRIIKKELDVTN